MSVKTNDLKKGTNVILRNGWKARIEDNKKGNTRLATVYGTFTEMGSIYSTDIVQAEINGVWVKIELTDTQTKVQNLRRMLNL